MRKRRLAPAVLILLLALALAAVTATGAKYVVTREGSRATIVVTASSGTEGHQNNIIGGS